MYIIKYLPLIGKLGSKVGKGSSVVFFRVTGTWGDSCSSIFSGSWEVSPETVHVSIMQ